MLFKTTLLIALVTLSGNTNAEMETIPQNFYTSDPDQQWRQVSFNAPNAPQDMTAPTSRTVTVVFPKSSSLFRPTLENAELLTEAQEAALIMIRGRSSTLIPSQKDENLCLARAQAARKYLIDHGVSPLKIAINYASATEFVAANDTPEGMVQNQRVEIEMIYVNGVGIGNGS